MQSEIGRILSHVPPEGKKGWREFGESCGIDKLILDDCQIAYFDGPDPYPGRHLLNNLLFKMPNFLFREIVANLRHIEREDIIKDAICRYMHNQS